jgi:hypothetical protein
MADIRLTPGEQVISEFKNSADLAAALDQGLKALVEELSFETGAIALAYGDGLICSNVAPSSGALSIRLEKKMPAAESAMLVMFSFQSKGLFSVSNDSADQAKWKAYFDLLGDTSKSHHRLIFLRSKGFCLGLLSLQSNKNELTPEQEALILRASEAMSVITLASNQSAKLKAKTEELART